MATKTHVRIGAGDKYPSTKPRKRKGKKLPKRPKASAPMKTWENYHVRKQEVIDANLKAEKYYEAQMKLYKEGVEYKKKLMAAR